MAICAFVRAARKGTSASEARSTGRRGGIGAATVADVSSMPSFPEMPSFPAARQHRCRPDPHPQFGADRHQRSRQAPRPQPCWRRPLRRRARQVSRPRRPRYPRARLRRPRQSRQRAKQRSFRSARAAGHWPCRRRPQFRRALPHSLAACARRRRYGPSCHRGKGERADHSSCAAKRERRRHRCARSSSSDNSRLRPSEDASRLREVFPSTCRAWSYPWPYRAYVGNVEPRRASGAATWRWFAASDSRRERRSDPAPRLHDSFPTRRRRVGDPCWFLRCAASRAGTNSAFRAPRDRNGRRRDTSRQSIHPYERGRDEGCACRHWRWLFRSTKGR